MKGSGLVSAGGGAEGWIRCDVSRSGISCWLKLDFRGGKALLPMAPDRLSVEGTSLP